MPISANCVRYAREMSEHPMETVFPVLKYHYRWNEITDDSVKDRALMYKNGYARLRGAMTPLYRTKFSSDNIYPADDSTAPLNEKGEAYLREFLEVCKESEIPHIVFAEFPHVLDTEKAFYRHQRVNRAAEIIQEEGFDFIDFTQEIDARWEDSAELIVKFYKYYDDYTSAHADDPYKEVDYDLYDTLRTAQELKKVKP